MVTQTLPEPAVDPLNPGASAGVAMFGRFSDRMQQPTKEVPAMRIAILIVASVVLVLAAIIFFAAGGPKLFAPKVAPPVITTVAPAPAQPAANPDLTIPQVGGVTR